MQYLLSSLEISDSSEFSKVCRQKEVFDQKTEHEPGATGSLASGSLPDIFDDESTVSTLPRLQNLSQYKIVGLCPSLEIRGNRRSAVDGADASVDEDEGNESYIVPSDSCLNISKAANLPNV
jgi:hypothetical protein